MPSRLDITSLPSDIIYDVLSRTQDLQALQPILLSHSTFYTTFQSRRTLIIKSVFCNQIFRNHIPHNDISCKHIPPIKQRTNKLEFTSKAEHFIDNLPVSRKDDAVLLYEAAWSKFNKMKPLDSIPVRLGNAQILAYIQSGQSKEALIFAENLWNILPSRKYDFPNFQWNRFRCREHGPPRSEQSCAKLLCQLYREHGRIEDSFAIQEAVLSRLPWRSELFRSWAIQISDAYWGEERYEECAVFQRRIWQMFVENENAWSVSALEWARFLVLGYSQRGMKETAVEVEREVMNLLFPRTMEYVAWARHLIQTLKGMGRMQEALEVRLGVWNNYRPDMNGYYGWARQIAEDYRALDREDDAIAVEEAVWQRINNRLLASPKDSATVYHARTAGKTLARSYRQKGALDLALSIESLSIM